MERFADFVIEKRNLVLGIIIICTLFFAYFASTIKVETIFRDLLPQQHEYIKLHNEARGQFGGANQVYIMVQVRKGGKYKDIFNPDSLAKVKYITEELLKFDAVDRYKIVSIASRTVKSIKVTSYGYQTDYIMFPDVPQTEQGLKELRLNVYASPMAYPGLVSLDSKSAMIMVDFFEDRINYETTFKQLQELRHKVEDENNIVAIAGEPMHLGYINSYVKDVLKILAYTTLAMMVVFFLYFRSKRGMLLPITAAAVSAIWGIGFLGLLGYNLDPLVLVFPFLIAARAASHSVQIVKRYLEEAYNLGEGVPACKKVIAKMFRPAFAGIFTDAFGIIVIALTPIKILQKITIPCAFWAFATVVVVMILVPVLLAYMPLRTAKPGSGLLDKTLRGLGAWIMRSGKYIVLVVSLGLLIWGCTYLDKVPIGNAVPGSEILWPYHRYNVDSFRISFSMPILNPLYIILDTQKPQGAAKGDFIREVNKFIKYMQKTPQGRVMFVQCLLGQLPGMHRGVRESDPNWNFLPYDDPKLEPPDLRVGMLYRAITFRGVGALDRYVDLEDQRVNVIINCRDKTAQTVKQVIARVKKFINEESTLQGKIKYRLAGGVIGVQAAINETLTAYQLVTFLLAIGGVYLFCAYTFKSFVGGMIVTIPLLLSNALSFTFMVLNDPPLPLTTATLPVASLGIGLGVDYGIYLVSRIMEEYHIKGNLPDAIGEAMGTTGKAIVYTATTLLCGIVFWFLSKLMFQALMGLLLAIILTLNMFGALLIVPSFIALFKPKFIVGKNRA